MSEDLLIPIGATQRISHVVDAGEVEFTVDAVTASIYDSAGTAVVNGASGSVDSASAATAHEIWYLWTPTIAGDYTYRLFYTVGSQTLPAPGGGPGQITVLAAVSKYDRWVNRIIDWLVLSEVGEAQRDLSWKQLRDAALAAVRRYSVPHPRREITSVSLTAGVWEYALPGDWDYEISGVEALEYPVDAAVQWRRYLLEEEFIVDDQRAVWGFKRFQPSAGQTARLAYRAPHALSDTEDTVPAIHFDAVTQYAAGLALEQLANRAPRQSGPNIGADYVEARTKQQQYSAQAERMKRDAERGWGATRIYVV